MVFLLHDLINEQEKVNSAKPALVFKSDEWSYGFFKEHMSAFAKSVILSGLEKNDRIAVFLPKQFETVGAMFGASAAGCVFVPVNPVLKPKQVSYILKDCNVRLLVTSPDRLQSLKEELGDCADLTHIVVVGGSPENIVNMSVSGKIVTGYEDFITMGGAVDVECHSAIDADMVAIFYTSGSTGMPKGVVLSHKNMLVGAQSVATYLKNTPEDVILSVIPLSFDVGFNQLTTAFLVGATAVMMNYLLPRDILLQAAKHNITGITCVPPLWMQLSGLDWPEEAVKNIRYIATTGGRMPIPITRQLQEKIPGAEVYLMYGLTEAFRSTYLDPQEVDARPDSIGKAIPNAEIMVVRPDGTNCDVDEPGELVHRGALVGLGYWNDPDRTNERYRPAPGQPAGLPNPEIAVWSGDTVRKDKDGFLYFVGRKDEMIKTCGIRVSPTELEESIYSADLVDQVVALGISDEKMGQAIWIVASSRDGEDLAEDEIIAYCRKQLPGYMVPHKVIIWNSLPQNPNGKIDRKAIETAVAEPA